MASKKIITFSLEKDADVIAKNITVHLEGSTFDLHWRDHDPIEIHTPLVGRHNVANITGVAATALACNIPIPTIKKGIEDFRAVPGRLEAVPTSLKSQILVDYCHTPDALQKCLEALKDIPHKRLMTLVGCGGDRDPMKRPLMGAIALRFSDHVIVTSDNPRTENPDAIIRDMEKGMIDGKGRYVIIKDRRDALRYGVELLRDGDIFLIAGKGHETYQIIGREKFPFDDRTITAQFLRELGKGVE